MCDRGALGATDVEAKVVEQSGATGGGLSLGISNAAATPVEQDGHGTQENKSYKEMSDLINTLTQKHGDPNTDGL